MSTFYCLHFSTRANTCATSFYYDLSHLAYSEKPISYRLDLICVVERGHSSPAPVIAVCPSESVVPAVNVTKLASLFQQALLRHSHSVHHPGLSIQHDCTSFHLSRIWQSVLSVLLKLSDPRQKQYRKTISPLEHSVHSHPTAFLQTGIGR